MPPTPEKFSYLIDMVNDTISSLDDNPLLRHLQDVLMKNYQNEQFSVEDLAREMNMSRSHLHRKLKRATGKSANQYIREYRLNCARDLLLKKELSISEIAYEVGFSSQSYFSRCFAERYGYPPGELKHLNQGETKKGLGVPSPDKYQNLKWAIPILGLALILMAFLIIKSQPDEPANVQEVNPQAHELYQKGLYESGSYNREANLRAIKYFQQAVEIDPDYAAPYAGMARSFICMASIYQSELDPENAFTLAKPNLDKTLALDPDQEEARTFNAFYFAYHKWDFETAEKEYQKAIQNNYPRALYLYSGFLQQMGRYEEALTIARKLQEVDPFFPHTSMINSLYYTGDYEEAEEFAGNRLLTFNNYTTLEFYGFLKLNTGQYDAAIELFEKAIEVSGYRSPRAIAYIAAAHAYSDREDQAREIINELQTRLGANDFGSLRFFMALVYTSLGEKETAIQYLREAVEHHELEIPWLISEPQFKPLHDKQGFQELLEIVGFPDSL